MTLRNRQWLLASRPQGHVKLSDFELAETEMPEPDLRPGEVLVRNLAFHLAPTMRNWINDPSRSYRASVDLGTPVRGPGAAEVVKSANDKWPVGARMIGVSMWEDYSLLDPDNSPILYVSAPTEYSVTDALGVYGLNSLTAYVGLTEVGQPKAGETLVVSAAAGSVGSMVCQVGKLLGCRVIGIAGGPAKCQWLVDILGVDAAIDYKNDDVRQRLAELCPTGVDVFFDNVGGDILHAVMDNIAEKGRVAVCGQVSAYDSDEPAPGPKDMMKVVYWRVRIQGFVLGDYPDKVPAAREQLIKWVKEGKITHREDIRRGFEQLPSAFLDLFAGRNEGPLMVVNDA